MEAAISDKIFKCRCCLAEGKHQINFGAVHIKMFKKCLNLILAQDSRIAPVICSACVGFLRDAQEYRKVVMSAQKHLLRAVYNIEETMCIESLFKTSHDVPSIEDSKVKVEEEIDDNLDPPLLCSEDIADHKDENTEFKTELSPEQLSDWDALEGMQLKREIERTKPLNTKRKRRVKDGKIEHRRKRKKYDSESDTPISQIKLNKSQIKKKTERDPITSTPKRTESRQHSFVDNNKVRSNIILILKHSTILPFRNNFKSSYKCLYCDKLYIPFKELKEHIEIEHDDVSETAISKIVRSLQNLIVTADISCIKCRLCDEEFKSIENLIEHLCYFHKKIYHETDRKPSHGILGVDLSSDNLKCHICNKDFAFFKNLSVHMNEHYGSFVCYVCGKKFLSEHRYKCHVFKAHAEKETVCKHCGKTFSTEPSMAYHVRKEHLKQMIKCLKCPETFSLGQYVKRLNHMAEAHGIKKPVFKCDTCGREYANSGSLAAHKRYTHKRTKEHKCEICGYITVHNTVMKKHMDVHNGVKNYECEFCKKKFAKPYTLKLHLKIHLNDKRFVCRLCDAAFIQKNSLKSHLKSRHPDSGIDISKL